MPDMPLSIGSVVGGWAPAWEKAVDQLSDGVMTAREGRSGGIDLNVVFIIPGNAYRPDFKGVRLGRYSRASKTLLVEVALPEAEPGSSDPSTYVKSKLREALALAEGWASKKGLTDELSEAASIVNAIVPPSIGGGSTGSERSLEPASTDDYVTVVIPLPDGRVGTPNERERVYEIEEALIEALRQASAGEVSGHEFGCGTATILLWGANVDSLANVVINELRNLEVPMGTHVLKESRHRDDVARIDL